jgi:hypothetical protein
MAFFAIPAHRRRLPVSFESDMMACYVFDSLHNRWLQPDERNWGPFVSAAQFTKYDRAFAIATREASGALVLGWIDPQAWLRGLLARKLS